MLDKKTEEALRLHLNVRRHRSSPANLFPVLGGCESILTVRLSDLIEFGSCVSVGATRVQCWQGASHTRFTKPEEA